MSSGRPVVGQIFYVPLLEGGYAWGYVSLIDKGSVHLCSFFDVITETKTMPADLTEKPLALEDLPVGGAEFLLTKRHGDLRWTITKHHMPGEVRATHTLYIMRSRPHYQLLDLADKSTKRPATEAEIARYPDLSVPFPPFTTKQVEKAVRHLNIDPKLIGTDRGEATLH
ncbi:MAG TPA: hypothetical protein VGM83_17195 [Devosiaceae bacterium]|jgi:hypothetical protein